MSVLRAVQFEALKLSRNKEGFIFGMDPGLGKTLTALHEFYSLLQRFIVRRGLIICPNSVKSVWLSEIEKHGFPIQADDRMNKRNHAFIINYEALIYSGGSLAKEFMSGTSCMLIIDESHRLKNHRSKTTMFVQKELAPRANVVRLLTGTPATEGPTDLFSQLRLVGALPGANYYAFRNKFCETVAGYKGKKKVVGLKNTEKLTKLCVPYMFRATKEDWGQDLPEKTFSIREIPMTDQQKKLYKEMREEFAIEFEGKEVTVSMIMGAMTKLSQIASGFVRTDEGEDVWIEKNPPKLQAVYEWIEEFPENRKIVVASTNVAPLLRTAEWLRSKHIEFCEIHGKTEETIDQAKARFNNDDACRVALISHKKGGVGLTLLGTPNAPCSTMGFIQTTYSLLDRLQIIDRIHRIGQNYPCDYVDFVSAPIDREVIKALNRKENVVDILNSFFTGGNAIAAQQLQLA